MRFEVDAAERREAPADRLGEVHLGLAFCGQSLAKNLAQLGFHRVTMPGRASTQLFLERPVDVPDRQSCVRGVLVSLHASVVADEGIACNACPTVALCMIKMR
jgi:hypothetical protein